jgi:NMD protein affecting ribosome stability and mRNA decay
MSNLSEIYWNRFKEREKINHVQMNVKVNQMRCNSCSVVLNKIYESFTEK